MKRDSLCEETHRLVHLHLRFGWGILIGLRILTAWRWLGAQRDAPTDIAYLILAWVLAGLVGLQGWFGGEMVYGHGAGVEVGRAACRASGCRDVKISVVAGSLKTKKINSKYK